MDERWEKGGGEGRERESRMEVRRRARNEYRGEGENRVTIHKVEYI